MLQIIGWLGCLYLVVKGLEIAGDPSRFNNDGKTYAANNFAMLLCYIGAFVFAVWLFIQGSTAQSIDYSASSFGSGSASEYSDCLERATTSDAIMNCVKLLD